MSVFSCYLRAAFAPWLEFKKLLSTNVRRVLYPRPISVPLINGQRAQKSDAVHGSQSLSGKN